MTHVPRYVPAKTNQGWPVVGLITLLTLVLIAAVTVPLLLWAFLPLGADGKPSLSTKIQRKREAIAEKKANERVLAMIQETRATKLLGDVTNFKLIGAEDQRWLNDDWIPRTIEAGLRYVALVQPVFYFNQVAVQTVAQRIDPETLVVSHFDSAQAARRWLWGAHRYPGADAGEPG